MNRPMKFRVWDRVERKMWSTTVKIEAVFEEGYYPCPKSEDVDFLQFTGLHDKNEKEIYEGDVLKPVGNGIKETNRKVEFVDGSFCYSLEDSRRSGGYSALGHTRARLFEIVGNIYENPELL